LRYYFRLQIVRIERWFKDIGSHPLLGIAVGLFLFVLLSKFLFYKTEFAVWIYCLIGVSSVFKLNEKARTDQLKKIYSVATQTKIRIVENLIVSVPFLIYLLYQRQFNMSIGLLAIAVFLSLITTNMNFNKAIPTPFRKRPFENIIGFRKYFVFIVLLNLLILKAIQVDNYNLAIVAFGFIFLILMSFHFIPEQKYFVWIFKDNSFGFIKRKIIDSIICGFIIVTPSLLCICIFFPSKMLVSLIVLAIGLIYLSSMVLAKYSAYPHSMNIPQGLLYGLSLWFPPLLIIIIPIFYKQSKRKIDLILE